MRIRTTFTLLAVGLLTCSLASAQNILLAQIPGVEGTCELEGLGDWIECAGMDHHVPGIPKPMQLCNQVPDQVVTFKPEEGWAGFDLCREVDTTSPRLMHLCESGTRIHPMKLALCSVVDGKPEILAGFLFEDAIIISYIVMAPGFGDRSALYSQILDVQPLTILKIMPKQIIVTPPGQTRWVGFR